MRGGGAGRGGGDERPEPGWCEALCGDWGGGAARVVRDGRRHGSGRRVECRDCVLGETRDVMRWVDVKYISPGIIL